MGRREGCTGALPPEDKPSAAQLSALPRRLVGRQGDLEAGAPPHGSKEFGFWHLLLWTSGNLKAAALRQPQRLDPWRHLNRQMLNPASTAVGTSERTDMTQREGLIWCSDEATPRLPAQLSQPRLPRLSLPCWSRRRRQRPVSARYRGSRSRPVSFGPAAIVAAGSPPLVGAGRGTQASPRRRREAAGGEILGPTSGDGSSGGREVRLGVHGVGL
jgi:hypothetical protein